MSIFKKCNEPKEVIVHEDLDTPDMNEIDIQSPSFVKQKICIYNEVLAKSKKKQYYQQHRKIVDAIHYMLTQYFNLEKNRALLPYHLVKKESGFTDTESFSLYLKDVIKLFEPKWDVFIGSKIDGCDYEETYIVLKERTDLNG